MSRASLATTPFLLAGALISAACASSGGGGNGTPAVTPAANLSVAPPSPDPRVGLKPGLEDAGEAAWNMRLITNMPPSASVFADQVNSDLAFTRNYAIQGNYNGWQIWNISNPARPKLERGFVCPASQSDVSVYRNLLFVSGEDVAARLDCGLEGVADSVSSERLRGIRVFDITDINNPKNIANVQTCRGSHTHTVVTDPRDPANVYVYVSGSSAVRSPRELPGCSDLAPDQDPNSARFRIEVIRVPLANPQSAAIVSSPRIFSDLGPAPGHGENPEDLSTGVARSRERASTGPDQCHDITVYPAIGFAGGACRGYGLLLDIRDPANPKRLFAAADSNFVAWHSATFNNDGTKVLFTDEWGGGRGARCRATDKKEWGANAIFTRVGDRLEFQSYYKVPAPQTATENCVAHNGSLVPIPGRDVMVQGWYQGGVSVFDWTDPKNAKEIAFFDRGPVDPDELTLAGSWSAYWYNGYIYSSEIMRGLDVFELLPSGLLSQNEIDAAKTVRFEYLNTQEQPKLVWPASFALARAYVDQLERSGGLAAAQIASTRADLTSAERTSAAQRRDALTALAGRLDAAAQASRDQAKVRLAASAVRELAGTGD
jgi:hypothetical protein